MKQTGLGRQDACHLLKVVDHNPRAGLWRGKFPQGINFLGVLFGGPNLKKMCFAAGFWAQKDQLALRPIGGVLKKRHCLFIGLRHEKRIAFSSHFNWKSEAQLLTHLWAPSGSSRGTIARLYTAASKTARQRPS